ncbi:MAG: hypothetical protein GY946_05705 [bacterium]|nr:hypothetical protein [bacterium]
MKPLYPFHFTGPEARLAAELLEVLIDTLIDFYAHLSREYADWLEPVPDEFERN